MRYDYICSEGHIEEHAHGMNETIKPTCMAVTLPSGKYCGKTMQKYFGNINFEFNGNFKGWFDYGANRYINSNRQIKEIEKREKKVFGGNDLEQEADRKKTQIAEKKEQDSAKRIEKKLEALSWLKK